MKDQSRFTKPRIVAFVLTGLIPLAVILLGVILVLGGTIVNLTFLLGFVILPCGAFFLLYRLIFSGVKTLQKTGFAILILAVFLISSGYVTYWGNLELLNCYRDEEIGEHYDEVITNFYEMPRLSDIGQVESVEHCDYYSSQASFFTCEGDALICKYDIGEYETQKALLAEKYVFQSEPMVACGHSCEPAAEIDGYLFRVLSIGNDEASFGEYQYPKCMVLIATNDTTQEIVYLSFYDDDLDYIESLSDFILNDCGWKHMR